MAAVITILIALVVIALAVAAARDMDRRGHKGEVYALAVLFVLPIGLMLWAHDRRKPPR